MQFVDLHTPFKRLEQNIRSNIDRVFQHSQFIMGPEIKELEANLANFVGVKHCITASNGTDAILMTLMAMGIKPGDEIITTAFSFFATAEVIAFMGAKAVFVDIDPKTYNLDPQKIEAAITSKTKLILPVSLYGQCADFDAINAIAKKYNLPVLEDAAQSIGATYKKKQSCSLTTAAATSFFPSKPLGCYGDGGACFTNDDSLAAIIKQIRDHGQDRRYHHVRIGMNGRMDTLQAAILLAKLSIFKEEIALREQVGQRYTELLKDSFCTPYVEQHNTCVYAQYTIQVENRDAIQEKLKQLGIPTAIHYPVPLHKQPIFADQYPNLSLPHAETIATKVISLPMHPYLKKEEQQFIVDKLMET